MPTRRRTRVKLGMYLWYHDCRSAKRIHSKIMREHKFRHKRVLQIQCLLQLTHFLCFPFVSHGVQFHCGYVGAGVHWIHHSYSALWDILLAVYVLPAIFSARSEKTQVIH
ncbi:uncharacterized protein BJ212DRAFT_1320667, partial [Suillus subaureus]